MCPRPDRSTGGNSGPTLSEGLASYICGLSYDDIPAAAVDVIKTVVAHDLTVALAGRRSEEVTRAVALLDTDLASPGEASVFWHRRKAAPADSAYANAVMIRALRQEDTILPTGVHPGAMLVAAALAVGEQRGSSGRDVITALIAGYDVVGKLAAAHPVVPGQAHRTPSHTYGAFGVAAVAARLTGLDEEQTVAALGWAGNLAAMITDGFRNHQYGAVTRNGLTAAYLGYVRAPAARDALEGDPGFYRAQVGAPPVDIDRDLGSLGMTWEVMTSVVKPFPCMAFNVIPALLLQRLLAAHSLAADEIACIEVRRAYKTRSATMDSKGPWSARGARRRPCRLPSPVSPSRAP